MNSGIAWRFNIKITKEDIKKTRIDLVDYYTVYVVISVVILTTSVILVQIENENSNIIYILYFVSKKSILTFVYPYTSQ